MNRNLKMIGKISGQLVKIISIRRYHKNLSTLSTAVLWYSMLMHEKRDWSILVESQWEIAGNPCWVPICSKYFPDPRIKCWILALHHGTTLEATESFGSASRTTKQTSHISLWPIGFRWFRLENHIELHRPSRFEGLWFFIQWLCCVPVMYL